jgi:hypothetical protein
VAIVCGFFGPNYTRRLSFGSRALRRESGSLLIIHGLFPAERYAFVSADTQLPTPKRRTRQWILGSKCGIA